MPKVVIYGAFFRGRTFPSLNDWLAEYGKNPKAGGRMKSEFMNICIAYIRKSLMGWKVTKPPVILHYRFYERNKGIRRDVSNIFNFCSKVFEDALQKCGTIKNDNPDWIENFTTEFHWIDGEPYIEIEIEEKG